MASESSWHVLWIKRNIASVIKKRNKNEKKDAVELIFCVVNNKEKKSTKLRGGDLKNKTKSIQKCCCSFVLWANFSAKQYFVGSVQWIFVRRRQIWACKNKSNDKNI